VPLKREILEEIIDKAKDWALMHGKKINFNRVCVSSPVIRTLVCGVSRTNINKQRIS
jgi:hypothetical protein